MVLVDDVGGISLTCNDALGTSTVSGARWNLLRTTCGLRSLERRQLGRQSSRWICGQHGRLKDPSFGPQRDPQVAHRVTTARVAASSWNPASSEMRAAAPGGTPTSNVTPQERHVA